MESDLGLVRIAQSKSDPVFVVEVRPDFGRPSVHKSRLAGFIIDCRTVDLAKAAEFWSAALGKPIRQLPGGEGEKYVRLEDPDLHIEVQAVSHDSRVHLDIEADDVDAEVRRLEALGATRIEKVRTWWIMQAPTGQRFCVVRKTSARFDETAKTWG